MSNNSQIIIEAPQVIQGKKMFCHFKCIGEIGKYFNENTFMVETNENLQSVPNSILLIPALANICPVAWFTGSDIYVEEIDLAFLEALNIVKESFKKMYPKFSYEGNIHYKTSKQNHGYGSGKSGLFFSGGVDSLTSIVRKRHESPYLLSVWGADIPLSENLGWAFMENEIKKFSEEHQLEPLFIRSNFRTFLNDIQFDVFKEKDVSGWWEGVQCALGIIGLSAPLAFVKGMNTIYLASSDNPFSRPQGSDSSIDNNIKWGETQVISEGMELLKLEKLQFLAEYIKNVEPTMRIRVCWESTRGPNCSKCEKCTRTMAGLIAVGLDPNNHGFNMNKDSQVTLINNYKDNYFQTLTEDQLFLWNNIKSHLTNNHTNSEYSDFFQWILETDFTYKF